MLLKNNNPDSKIDFFEKAAISYLIYNIGCLAYNLNISHIILNIEYIQ